MQGWESQLQKLRDERVKVNREANQLLFYVLIFRLISTVQEDHEEIEKQYSLHTNS